MAHGGSGVSILFFYIILTRAEERSLAVIIVTNMTDDGHCVLISCFACLLLLLSANSITIEHRRTPVSEPLNRTVQCPP